MELKEKTYHWNIKQALTVPILVAGTEKQLVILNVMTCMVIIFSTHFDWRAIFTLPLGLFIHGICMQISKRDARMLAVFQRSRSYKGFYHAVPMVYKKRGKPRAFYSLPKELRRGS
jgi:type IV secretory pathway TrbD component